MTSLNFQSQSALVPAMGSGERMRTDGRINGTRLESQRRIEEKFGCGYSEYLELRDHADKPIASYVDQRNNAKRRGVEWRMNLVQWWTIWQRSGRWSERGRGSQFYCMCRKDDVGPYSIDNVFIGKFRWNSSDHPNKKGDLPMGVRKASNGSPGFRAVRRIDGKTVTIGTFATPDLASAAYLADLRDEGDQQ